MYDKIRIDIPDDLKKISKRKFYLKIIILIAVYAVEAILFLVFNDKFMSAGHSYIMLNAFGMIVIPPVVIIHPMIKDKTWVGEIYDYKHQELAAYSGKLAHTISYLGQKDRIYLKLRNGNDFFDKIYDRYPHTKDPTTDQYCRKGSVAVHVFGTKYPTVIPNNSGDKSICVVCGLVNVGSFDKCDGCGHTLIKHIRR